MYIERGVREVIDPGTKRINTSPKLNKRSTFGCIVAFLLRNLAGGFSFQRTFGQAQAGQYQIYQPLKPPRQATKTCHLE